MAKMDFLASRMRSRTLMPADYFDMLQGPPVSAFFTPDEVAYIKHLILRNKNDMKIKALNSIMKAKGFSRLSGGTNRIVYRYYEDPSFVLKVALDRVGLNDNNAEFRNQQYLKPYVCKIFNSTPCGTMATIERVLPITSKEEFQEISDAVFEIITDRLIGKYVAEDIGKAYFLNWGIRSGFGPVLLDYPYVYRLDGAKLFCINRDEFGRQCGGLIDYDNGFNKLICTKCGRRYFASDLQDDNPANDLVITRGGKYPMDVILVNRATGKEVKFARSSNIITKEMKTPKPHEKMSLKDIHPVLKRGNEVIYDPMASSIEKPEKDENHETKVPEEPKTEAPETEEKDAEQETVEVKPDTSGPSDEPSEWGKAHMNETTESVTEEVAEEVVIKAEEDTKVEERKVGNDDNDSEFTKKLKEDVKDSMKTFTQQKAEIDLGEVSDGRPAKKTTKKSSGAKKAGGSKKASNAKVASKFIMSPDVEDTKEE